MSFFDGNFKILLLKAEMINPEEFTNVCIASNIIFCFVLAVLGVSVNMVLGHQDLLAAFQGDSVVFLTGKVASNLACTIWLMLAAQEMQTILQKIICVCQ